MLEHGKILKQLAAADVPAQPVDRTPPRRRGDPPARIWRQAVSRPDAKGQGERILRGTVGSVDV